MTTWALLVLWLWVGSGLGATSHWAVHHAQGSFAWAAPAVASHVNQPDGRDWRASAPAIDPHAGEAADPAGRCHLCQLFRSLRSPALDGAPGFIDRLVETGHAAIPRTTRPTTAPFRDHAPRGPPGLA